MNIKLLCLLSASCVCIQLVTATNSNRTEKHRLYQELFVDQGYNFRVQPTEDFRNKTFVNVSLVLKTINDFDEMSEKLQTSVYLVVQWFDQFLTWNGSDYSGLYYTYWPQNDIWKPDIILYNSVKKFEDIGHETIYVENFSSGLIKWFPMELFETSCDVDMRYFPFDIQTCEIQLMCWSYTSVTLRPQEDHIILQYYSSNPLWEILETDVYLTKISSIDVVSYKIKLQRKPQHEVLTLFVPVFLLTVLALFVFALPNGGDRSGYAVTVFLAFSVYFTIVDAVMPPNSEKISYFSVYLVIQTVQSTVITVLAVLLTKVESLDESTKIPRVLVFLVRLSGGCCRNRAPGKVYRLKHIAIETDPTDANKNRQDEEIVDESLPCTWNMVIDAVDRISIIVFSLVFIISTVSFFCIITLHAI